MSGHSRWAQIKRKKAATDVKRGKAFAKLIRGIEVAARDAGTSNPENNMTLAAAISRAKDALVPTDTIERAARRGAGEGDEGVTYERVVYEGYGPNGVALLVEALTENRNRTGSDVRSVFARGGGNLGEPGSVAWMFERKGVIGVARHASEEDVFLVAAEAGATDVSDQGDRWEVVCEMQDYARVREALEGAELPVSSADLTMIPSTTVPLDLEAAKQVVRLMWSLEELDDVENVYPNFDVPEEAFAEVG